MSEYTLSHLETQAALSFLEVKDIGGYFFKANILGII